MPIMSTVIPSKSETLRALDQNKSRIRALGVEKLGLFGSFAREVQHSESDIDLLVKFKAGAKSFDGFMELADFLEHILARPVELVTTEALSPYLAPYIFEEVEYVNLGD